MNHRNERRAGRTIDVSVVGIPLKVFNCMRASQEYDSGFSIALCKCIPGNLKHFSPELSSLEYRMLKHFRSLRRYPLKELFGNKKPPKLL